MQPFVPLRIFSAYYSSHESLYDAVILEQFKTKILALNTVQLSEIGISAPARDSFVISLTGPKTLLFHEWISSNPGLLGILTNQIIRPFADLGGVLRHHYFPDFQQFLSPFLCEVLLRSAEADRDKALTYFVLLDESTRVLVESHFIKPLKKQIATCYQELESAASEADLIRAVTPLLDHSNSTLLNQLSKAHYAQKIAYVDVLFSMLNYPFCTNRLANRIFKTVDLLDLTTEHELELEKLRDDFRLGKLRLKSHLTRRVSRVKPYKIVIITSSIIGLLILGYYVALFFGGYDPFKNAPARVDQVDNAFVQFTPAERKKIDSLIQTFETQALPDETGTDPGYGATGGVALKIRKPYRNQKMESIYEDLQKDAQLALLVSADTCPENTVSYDDFPLAAAPKKSRSGAQLCTFRNDSAYDAILFVAEDLVNGAVYSYQLASNTTREIGLKDGDLLTLVYGNHYTRFIPPRGTNTADLPSGRFMYHFCEVDVNYSESMNVAYRVNFSYGKKLKVMITGNKGHFVQLIDVNDNLSDY